VEQAESTVALREILFQRHNFSWNKLSLQSRWERFCFNVTIFRGTSWVYSRAERDFVSTSQFFVEQAESTVALSLKIDLNVWTANAALSNKSRSTFTLFLPGISLLPASSINIYFRSDARLFYRRCGDGECVIRSIGRKGFRFVFHVSYLGSSAG